MFDVSPNACCWCSYLNHGSTLLHGTASTKALKNSSSLRPHFAQSRDRCGPNISNITGRLSDRSNRLTVPSAISMFNQFAKLSCKKLTITLTKSTISSEEESVGAQLNLVAQPEKKIRVSLDRIPS
jgi:hypothetical protein